MSTSELLVYKYIRLVRAYLLAYDKGLDIVAAEEWLKQLKRQIDGSTCKRIDTGSQRGRQRDT